MLQERGVGFSSPGLVSVFHGAKVCQYPIRAVSPSFAWFCITTLCDWLKKKLAPFPNQSFRRKARALLKRVFPRLTPLYAFASSSYWSIAEFALVLIRKSYLIRKSLVLVLVLYYVSDS